MSWPPTPNTPPVPVTPPLPPPALPVTPPRPAGPDPPLPESPPVPPAWPPAAELPPAPVPAASLELQARRRTSAIAATPTPNGERRNSCRARSLRSSQVNMVSPFKADPVPRGATSAPRCPLWAWTCTTLAKLLTTRAGDDGGRTQMSHRQWFSAVLLPSLLALGACGGGKSQPSFDASSDAAGGSGGSGGGSTGTGGQGNPGTGGSGTAGRGGTGGRRVAPRASPVLRTLQPPGAPARQRSGDAPGALSRCWLAGRRATAHRRAGRSPRRPPTAPQAAAR